MYINKRSPVPVYYQLKNLILKKIEFGEYQPGSMIPSERELAETLGISRMTVRQALSQLVNDGVLYREQGRGSFVSKMKFAQKNIMSFSEIVKQRGSTPKTQVLVFQEILAEPGVATVLELSPKQKVYHCKRVRHADEVPIAIEESFIPIEHCPSLTKESLEGSLYGLLRQDYGYTISFIDTDIQARLATPDEQSILNIGSAVPLLYVAGVHYADTGMKLYYEQSVYRSDEFKYNVRVHLNQES